MRILLWASLAAASVALIPSAWSQQREARVALVIGNADYPSARTPLTSTKDARALADELRKNGFQVDLRENLGKAAMRGAIESFSAKVGPRTIALFYFSGYGLQAGKQSYLLPTDAQIWSEPDVAREGTSLQRTLTELHSKGDSIKIVIIDAGRRNPYEGRVRAVAAGLAPVSIPDNTLIMYSAAPDRPINESSGSTNIFTDELLKELRVPRISAEDVFNRVRVGVSNATRAQQIPWVSSSLLAQFSFGSSAPVFSQIPPLPDRPEPPVPPEPPPVRPEPPVPPPPPAPPPPAVDTPLSQEREAALKPLDSFRECANCPEMVVIAPGELMMGSPDTEPERYANEGPQHRVKIGRAFAAGKLKVTRDQFEEFARETNYSAEKCFTAEDGRIEDRAGRSFRNPGFAQEGTHPAVCVSWEDAKAYVAWLSKKTGRQYRLLTEAEWEYAARAGTTTPFWWGASISTDQANYNGETTYADGPKGEYRQRTLPADSSKPNAWGLYQVHGNAFEWVEDCWNDSYEGAPSDGAASSAGNCNRHVRRGGAWNYPPRMARSAYRDSRPAATRGSNMGLRVARTLEQGGR
jgi:formylglycine-generating enzyme required for sulfatase activity